MSIYKFEEKPILDTNLTLILIKTLLMSSLMFQEYDSAKFNESLKDIIGIFIPLIKT